MPQWCSKHWLRAGERKGGGVVLDKNPLKVEPTTIKDISVIETIKEGSTVYRAGESRK